MKPPTPHVKCTAVETLPTLVLVPCFSGAPWSTDQQQAFSPLPVIATTMPEKLDDVERYADALAESIDSLERYVVVGDSFGAAVALALAVRRPPGLVGLVLSGGFASDPLVSRFARVGSHISAFMPGVLYKQLTLRIHAHMLSSPFDSNPDTEISWSERSSRELFLRSTSWSSYVARVRAARQFDIRQSLRKIDVPTLVLSPSFDRLVAKEATDPLINEIPDVTHVVLEGTGHMFRFSHTSRYAHAIRGFLEDHGMVVGNALLS